MHLLRGYRAPPGRLVLHALVVAAAFAPSTGCWLTEPSGRYYTLVRANGRSVPGLYLRERTTFGFWERYVLSGQVELLPRHRFRIEFALRDVHVDSTGAVLQEWTSGSLDLGTYRWVTDSTIGTSSRTGHFFEVRDGGRVLVGGDDLSNLWGEFHLVGSAPNALVQR